MVIKLILINLYFLMLQLVYIILLADIFLKIKEKES